MVGVADLKAAGMPRQCPLVAVDGVADGREKSLFTLLKAMVWSIADECHVLVEFVQIELPEFFDAGVERQDDGCEA